MMFKPNIFMNGLEQRYLLDICEAINFVENVFSLNSYFLMILDEKLGVCFLGEGALINL